MPTEIIIAPISDNLEVNCHPAVSCLNLPVQQTKNKYRYERVIKTWLKEEKSTVVSSTETH